LSCLIKISSVFSLIFILSLSTEFLSSTCSSVLEWPSTVFFCLTTGTFYFQDFCLHLFFWGFPYLCSTPLLYFVLSSLIHISFFLCPLFHFGVCWSPLWVHLFLCLLMFFIFGVLKFLECILYILVNHV
jgi:hypothetical protein